MFLDTDRLMKRQRRMVQRNLTKVVKAMPRWTARLNSEDRDILVQALSDLEFYLAVLKDDVNQEKVEEAARGLRRSEEIP